MLALDKEKVWRAFLKLRIGKLELAERAKLNYRTVVKILDKGRINPGFLQQFAFALEIDPVLLMKPKL